MAVLERVRNWYASIRMPWRRWRLVAAVDAGDEIPEIIPARGIVLVGTTERPLWAAFNCPCGSGHQLMLNLNVSRDPSWEITGSHPMSIRPSVDVTSRTGRCHFLLRRGRIRWVPHSSSFGPGVRPR